MAITKTQEKNQVLNLIQGFFKEFQGWLHQSTSPSLSDLEEFLTANFQIISNGKTMARNVKDYLSRVDSFQKKYSRFVISKPLEEPLISENHVALYYKIDLTTHHGTTKQIYIIALATIEQNKISKWVQVAYQQGTGDWDA